MWRSTWASGRWARGSAPIERLEPRAGWKRPALLFHPMKTRTKRPAPSTLHFGDGTKEQWPAQLAYAIWLAVPAVALRTAGDKRAVQSWEFHAGRKSRRPEWPCPSGLPAGIAAALVSTLRALPDALKGRGVSRRHVLSPLEGATLESSGRRSFCVNLDVKNYG
jgi:hypothetical protein